MTFHSVEFSLSGPRLTRTAGISMALRRGKKFFQLLQVFFLPKQMNLIKNLAKISHQSRDFFRLSIWIETNVKFK
jgi:hypothetical protein